MYECFFFLYDVAVLLPFISKKKLLIISTTMTRNIIERAQSHKVKADIIKIGTDTVPGMSECILIQQLDMFDSELVSYCPLKNFFMLSEELIAAFGVAQH